MSYYQHHVFFCLNERPPGDRVCCAAAGAKAAFDHAKARVKELKLAAPGQVRVNKAGCMERCEEGPCVVVYPEGVWYRYVDNHDIDEIVDRHLVKGEIVERLKMDTP